MTSSPPPGAASAAPSRPCQSLGSEHAKPLSAGEIRALAERGTPRARERGSAFRALLARGDGECPAVGQTRAEPPRTVRPRPEPHAFDRDGGQPGGLRARRPRPLGPTSGEDAAVPGTGLDPFRPPSTVLAPPPHGAPAAVGSGVDRATAAALAERLVLGMRVGRVGHDGHVVQLRLRAREGAIDVRLRHEDGRLGVVLVAHGGALEEARRIEQALRDELAARGIAVDGVAVEEGSA